MKYSVVLSCIFLLAASLAEAQPLDFSNSAKVRVAEARTVAAEGDLKAALDILAPAEECSETLALSEQEAADCGFLDWIAAELAQNAPNPARSAAFYQRAAGHLSKVGATKPLAELAGVKSAERYLRAERPAQAAERLAEARALRRKAGLPVSPVATASARIGARMAIASGDPVSIEAETQFILGLTQQSPNDPIVIRDSNRILARLLVGMGLYLTAESALASAQAAAEMAVQTVAYTDPVQLAAACEGRAETLLESADLKRGGGDVASAYQDAARADDFAETGHVCAGHVPDRLQVKADLLRASIHLDAGQALSAHLRLAGIGPIGKLPVATQQEAAAAQINARLSLGFLDEAAAYYGDHPAAETLLADDVQERERRLAHARFALLQGDPALALASLQSSLELQRRFAPLDWFPLARIAYRQALILSERGEFAQAVAVQEAFDAEFGDFIAQTTVLMAESEGATAQATIEQSKDQPWADFIASGLSEKADGRYRHQSVRELQKMRMLLSLSLAVHRKDRAEVARLFAIVPEIGLPSQIGMVSHSQRAYTLGCLMAKGSGLECDLLIQWAADYPHVPPVYCVPDCGFIPDPGGRLPLTADVFRKGPLRAAFIPSVLDELATAAIEAGQEAALAIPRSADGVGSILSEGLADFMEGNAGATLAFRLAQQFSEGGAATASMQLGQRLLAQAPEVAAVLRERDRLSDLIADGLRKGTADSAEFAQTLAALEALAPDIAALPKSYGAFLGDTISRYDIPKYLPEGEVFVLIVTTDTASYVFAIKGEEFRWHRVPIRAGALEKTVAKLRQSLDPTGPSRAATPLAAPVTNAVPFDPAAAFDLYQAFFGPLAPFLGKETLHLVVEGPLSALPLSLLVKSPPPGQDDDPQALRATDWMVRENAMVFYTSPAGLIVSALQRYLPQGDLPFVGFGDPVFTPPDAADAPFAGLAPLPGTRTEVETLADLLSAGKSSVFLREAATKPTLLVAELSRAKVIAFATHGLLAGQMGMAEPGLVLSMPAKNPEPMASYLSASDAAELDLNADWVLLSACNTAAADGQPDSTGLSGLARGFIFAGARSLLVSHWPVRDDAAVALTTGALAAQSGGQNLSKAKALQAAILALLQDMRRPENANPAIWAPFVLIGNG